jgi:hypothetical protein
MTNEAFAQELVSRLAGVLPAGFAVRADGETVHIDAPDGLGAATSLSQIDPDEAEPDDYADAAWNVLSMAQDVVCETRGEPWPIAVGADLPDPGTRADGRSIALWFGSEAQPVLTLPEIVLE